MRAVMTNEGQTDVDFKFRLSPEETVRGQGARILPMTVPCCPCRPRRAWLRAPLRLSHCHGDPRPHAACHAVPHGACACPARALPNCSPSAPLQEIIERLPHPPQSLILLGRSGTGKTT